jgi:RimJ/RimL family protein N-acetyltransferase
MEVRTARIEDCEAVARGMKVVVEEGRWLATEPGASVEELTERFRIAVEADEHLLFVLEEGSELAGSLGLHPTPSPGVLALGMWVLPRWRGQGGGRMLVQAGLDARPTGVHKIELEAFPDNEAAIALYCAMGFEEEGLRRRHLRRRDGSLRDCLMMARLFET